MSTLSITRYNKPTTRVCIFGISPLPPFRRSQLMIPMLKQLPLKTRVIGYRLQFDKVILSILSVTVRNFLMKMSSAVSLLIAWQRFKLSIYQFSDVPVQLHVNTNGKQLIIPITNLHRSEIILQVTQYM